MKRVIVIGAMLTLAAAFDVSAQSAPQAIFSDVTAALANEARNNAAALKGVAERQIVGMRLDRLFDATATSVLLNVDGHDWVANIERPIAIFKATAPGWDRSPASTTATCRSPSVMASSRA